MNFCTIRKLLFFYLLLFSGKQMHAQDMLINLNNDTIKGKVIELTTDKIKFRILGANDRTFRSFYKNQIKEIIYENKSKLTIIFNPYEVSKDLLIPNQHSSIKIDLGAPALNHYTISFETRIKKNRNLELKASLIGTNVNNGIDHSEGGSIRAGIKYIETEDVSSKGLIYKHALKGSYIKPELIFTYYRSWENFKWNYYAEFAAVANFGRQFVLEKHILFDFFGGIGAGIQGTSYDEQTTNDRKQKDLRYTYSHLYLGPRFPMVLTAGAMIGYIF